MNTISPPSAQTSLSVVNDKTPIWVMNSGDVSANFSLLATRAQQKICVRVAGGCSGMSDLDKHEMAAFFLQAFEGFRGMIWSGATRQLKSTGEVDLMVTEIPAMVAAANPGALALGTAPRTGTLHLVGESRLQLDGDGTLPNPSLSGMAIIQNGSDEDLGWDGDLDAYFSIMKKLSVYGGFTAVGVVAWNGGGVTASEILRSAQLGWPTIVVKGSGRKADEFAARLEAGDEDLLRQLPLGHKLMVADRSDPGTLRRLLLDHGLLTE